MNSQQAKYDSRSIWDAAIDHAVDRCREISTDMRRSEKFKLGAAHCADAIRKGE